MVKMRRKQHRGVAQPGIPAAQNTQCIPCVFLFASERGVKIQFGIRGESLKNPRRISAYLQDVETVAQRGGATFDLYWQLRQILSFFLEMPGVFGADHFDGRDCSSRGKCSETCPLFFPVAGSVNNKNDATRQLCPVFILAFVLVLLFALRSFLERDGRCATYPKSEFVRAGAQ